MTKISVEACSWNRFVTRGLAVAPDVLGKCVEFPFGDSHVQEKLPTADDVRENHDESAKATIESWHQDGDRKVPIEKAFDLWIRVLRWKAMNGAICRPELHGPRSGWSTYLLDRGGHRFWAPPVVVRVRGAHRVTDAVWTLVESTLRRGQSTPVHFDLLFDAEYHFELGDLRRSVIDSAVACDAFMRQSVSGHLPASLGASARKHVERANVNPTLVNMFADNLDDVGRARLRALRARLETLFVARNEILHQGAKEDLTQAECKDFLQVARDLLAL